MVSIMYKVFVKFVQDIYGTNEPIPLHAPIFEGNEKKYLLETIDSTFVSSVGGFVNRFEESVAEYTGAQFAIATVNGTSALHIALKIIGVEADTEVITQSLTFVASCNAIRYCQATPVFVDVDRKFLVELLDKNLERVCTNIREDFQKLRLYYILISINYESLKN